MKQLKIHIAIDEETGRIVTKREFEGFREDSISNQFEILGIMENLIELQRNVVKTLARKSI